MDYDTRRDDWLRSQGFTVLRFSNNDVLSNTEGVLKIGKPKFHFCRWKLSVMIAL
ncbi:MAG: DUF559 domain-containing protein [Gammaproteobacteria bacterium]